MYEFDIKGDTFNKVRKNDSTKVPLQITLSQISHHNVKVNFLSFIQKVLLSF